MNMKLLGILALLSLSALGQQVQFREGGTWWDTEIAEGAYSTSSFNAWVSVQTTIEPAAVRRVLVKFTALDAQYQTINSATVIAIKQGFDATSRRDNWQAELRLGTYSVFQVPPAEVMVEIFAEVGTAPGGSKIIVTELQNPYFLVKSVNARNPVRLLSEFTRVGFDANEGPFLSGVVRVWDPNPLQLRTAVVEIRYSTDKWRTVKSAFGSFVQSNIHDFEFKLPKLTKSADFKDFVEEVEFAVRFVNSARVEIWDNNGRENYKQRILPSIGNSNPPTTSVLSGEAEVSVSVDQDSSFTQVMIGVVDAGTVASWSKSNTIVVDTSAVTGNNAEVRVRATALGVATVEKSFVFKVSRDGLNRKTFKLPDRASEMWLMQRDLQNESLLLMSSKNGQSTSGEFVWYDLASNAVKSVVVLPQSLQGQVLVDNSEKTSLFIYSPGRLIKVNSNDLNVLYEINLSLWSFCFVKSIDFSERFVFVMDSCDPQVFLFDKRNGALISRLDNSHGLTGQFLDDIVIAKNGDIYVFNNNQVLLLNPSTFAVQMTWSNSLGYLSEVVSGNNGTFWTFNNGVVTAFTLEAGRTVVKGRYQTVGRVLVSIVPGSDNSALVLDAEKKEILQFTSASSM